MTSIPNAEQMTGIQSTNLICTLDPFLEECENAEASMKKKKPSENFNDVRFCMQTSSWGWLWTYQSTCKVDACSPSIRAVEPFRLKAKKL